MASVVNLCLICIDRYFSVTKPFTYRAKRTRKMTLIFILGAWTFAILMWIPVITIWPLTHRDPEKQYDEKTCVVDMLTSPAINVTYAILSFYLPVTMMGLLYWLIFRETRKCTEYLQYLKNFKPKKEPGAGLASPFMAFRKNKSAVKSSLSTSTLGSPPMNRRDESVLSTSPLSPLAPNSNGNATAQDQHQKAGFWSGDVLNRIQQKLRIKSRNGSATNENGNNVDGNSFDKVVPSSNNHCESNNKGAMQTLVQNPPRAQVQAPTQVKMPSSEKKAAKTLSAILFVFFFTWLPYEICQIYWSSCADPNNCIPAWLWDFSYYLCYINSTINPFCYALCNRTFRQTFIQILTCNKKRPKVDPDYGLPTKKSHTHSMNHYYQASSSSS